MTNLHDLALRHVQSNGVSPDDAMAIVEHFARSSGKDIPWGNLTPFLPSPLADRIDRAAVNWMMAHQLAEGASE